MYLLLVFNGPELTRTNDEQLYFYYLTLTNIGNTLD